MDRLRAREPALLSQVVQDHARTLFRAARGMGLTDTAAEDLVQDVFTTFLETLDRFEGRSQLRTWLFGILHRKILEFRREQNVDQRHDPIDEVFESRFDSKGRWARPPEDLQRLLESHQAGKLIQACLGELPHAQRSVFTLREVEELDSAEICKILDISVTNLGVLMHRARARLRECLEAKGWRR
ncbi:MAG: sigma-70 family RNA polymerase sigma factor [Acidobacteria bacterium]|nr:sigma-70 family RNA polymerase sigma factor [Acidobacteriota bacterium]